ncbi:MAG: hypothetical protein QXP58_08760 [Thermoprotei archaeon]
MGSVINKGSYISSLIFVVFSVFIVCFGLVGVPHMSSLGGATHITGLGGYTGSIPPSQDNTTILCTPYSGGGASNLASLGGNMGGAHIVPRASELPTQPAPNQSSPIPSAVWDEQLGETFTQNFVSLAFNVTAVAQNDSYGYGPAYLLNGLSNSGYWYQVGLSYNWPYLKGGHVSGFEMNYEVFAPNGTSIFPASGGGGLLPFSGPVNPGDTVLLKLYFSGGNVIMGAFDWNTGASGSISYSGEGATYFVGLTNSPEQNGFFTGLMTEWYHVNPYYGGEQEVVYFEQGFSFSTAWLWMDEWDTNNGTILFSTSTPNPVQLTSGLYPYSYGGAVEYASSNMFITGEIAFSVSSFKAGGVTTDFGVPVSVGFSSTVQGGLPPYYYKIYVDGAPMGVVVTTSTSFQYTFTLTNQLVLGSNTYYVVVSDSSGATYVSPTYTITVNPDPNVSASYSSGVTDIGVPVTLSASASGGTPPYSYAWYVDGNLVGTSPTYSFSPSTVGVHSVYVSVTDSVGYTVSSSILNITVNPDPTLTLTGKTEYDVGQNLSFSYGASGGTQPYSFSVSKPSTGAPGTYTVNVTLTDAAGYTLTRSLVITVNPDPVLSASYSLGSTNFFYSNNVVTLNVSVSGGTPPYMYAWYLNGGLVASTNKPTYTYHLANMGEQTLSVVVTDGVGYTLHASVVANYTYNYTNIALVLVVVVVVLVGVALALRRGGVGNK